MPFTFSHPAIVLPLKNIFGKWVSLTALIIGSLTPDFEYFLRMKIQSNYSHTIFGVFWFNLPLGIILCFIFHNILKKTLIENSPKFIQSRMTELKNSNWNKYFTENWIIICFSIIIGAYSHIFWDSFTHSNAYFTNYFELNRKISGTEISIFKLLQHLSTLIGGVIIAWDFMSLKTNKIDLIKPNIKYWLIVLMTIIVILGLRILFGLKITAYGNIIVSGITAGMLGFIIASLCCKIKNGDNKS